MNRYLMAAMACVATVHASGMAAAAPTGGAAAPDVVRELTAEGYSVQINGSGGAPLSQCTVTGVHGIPDDTPGGAAQFTTVYVDVACESGG